MESVSVKGSGEGRHEAYDAFVSKDGRTAVKPSWCGSSLFVVWSFMLLLLASGSASLDNSFMPAVSLPGPPMPLIGHSFKKISWSETTTRSDYVVLALIVVVSIGISIPIVALAGPSLSRTIPTTHASQVEMNI